MSLGLTSKHSPRLATSAHHLQAAVLLVPTTEARASHNIAMKCHSLSLCTFIAVVGAAALAQKTPMTDVRPKTEGQTGTRPHMSSPPPSAHVNPAVLRKPMGNSSTTLCNDFYDVQGGSRDYVRGRYSRGPPSMSCNGYSVYIQNRSNPLYLYAVTPPSGGDPFWDIGSQDSMMGCLARGYAYMLIGGCGCPTDCDDDCAQQACKANQCDQYGECFGYQWLTYTGLGISGDPNPPDCNANSWCLSGLWLA